MDETVAQHYNELRDEYIARMDTLGLVVTFPDADELQIDLDSNQDWERHEASWRILARDFGLHESARRITPSRNGGERRHVRITMPIDLEPWQRLAFQAALGSDPIRELLSSIRLLNGDEHPSLLVETPEVADQLKQR
jgi:hypothetical protein